MIEFIYGGYNNILTNLEDGEFSEDVIYNAMQMQSELNRIGNTMREISSNAVSAIIQAGILNIETYKEWQGVIRTPSAKYALAEAHCYTNDFAQAGTVLREIPEMFEFTEFEYAEYNNYMQFHNFKTRLMLSERSWAEVQDDEIFELQNIAEAGAGRASTMAKGVLCFFFNICYEDEIIEGKSGDAPFVFVPEFDRKQNGQHEISYAVTDNVLAVNAHNVTKIDVFSMTGRVVCTSAGKNHVAIGHLPSGIYIVKIYTEDIEVYTDKFIKP
jgi:hypothetical protein